jgi:hypothetical protein
MLLNLNVACISNGSISRVLTEIVVKIRERDMERKVEGVLR